MWQFNELNGRFKAIINNRQFDIEPPGGPKNPQVWTLWLRRDKRPHMSLWLGKFPSIDEAKSHANTVAQQLVTSPHLVEEQ